MSDRRLSKIMVERLVINRLGSHGEFQELDVSYIAGAGQGINIGPGIFLTSIGGGLSLNPDEIRARAGVSVGGMTPAEAQRLLERRAKALEDVPVVFFSGDRRWRITPHRLGVGADWGSAVDAAVSQGEGLGPSVGVATRVPEDARGEDDERLGR